jgi:cytoskeletal protein CcmA (bactofilin family)
MFKRSKHAVRGRPVRIDTLIGDATRIVGDVYFVGGLHIDGHVEGNVEAVPESDTTLSISDGGVVDGAVNVSNLILNGTVNGDILASRRVELGATARVCGNVHYGLIEMAVGAQINGKLIHDSQAEAAAEEAQSAQAIPAA